MPFKIKKDGSLDVSLGGIALESAYPAVDGIPVRPIGCIVAQNSVHYELADGALDIALSEADGRLAIDCRVTGLASAHDIAPLAGARVEGCEKAFRQGFGIGGPSGFIGISKSFESDALIAVGSDSECVTIHAADHSKYRVHYRMDASHLSALIDVEGTLADDTQLPTLYISSGTDFSSALHACACEIAQRMGARTPEKPAFHWCSWYYLYHNLDQPLLEDYLKNFSKYRDIAPFKHIQIDAGYFPSCGDWLEPNARFPGGLKAAADSIIAAGYEPGIWIAPFMVGDESKLFREHPDWMLRNADGSLLVMSRQYNEPKVWGYRDSDYYVLDTSHPDAMAYIGRVFSTLRSWGYTLYKTDFMLWGMHDSTKVRRYTPGKTSFEYFRELMATVRAAIGEDSAWLGCIAPFMPAVGYVNMMRIAGDVGAQWEKDGFGPVNMIQEILADQYFGNVYWQNDPDAVLLRDFHIFLRPEQIEALAILQAISGGVITTSDPVHKLSPQRRALLRLIKPEGIVRPEFPFWQEQRDEKIITAKLPQGALAFFFNPSNRDITLACDWDHILGDSDWHLLRLHGASAPASAIPCLTVPAQSGILFFASRSPLDREPENMWNWEGV